MEATVSKGFLILAQNTNDIDYVRQAYALALSIKNTQSISNVSLATNNIVPEKYKAVFDNIVEIPWVDTAIESRYRGENRWKLYHITPYDETIVLDSDMLFTEDITDWWEYCNNFNLKFCSRVKTYKLDTVLADSLHRKAFISNQLTNPYFALHYFKKSDEAYEFYKTLEFVCNNWEWCYNKFAPKDYQNWLSMDLAAAIAIEISGSYNAVNDVCSPLEFIHMKTGLQGWEMSFVNWQDAVPSVFNSKGNLVVGNIKQSKLFHYIENHFLSNTVLGTLEAIHGKA